MIWTVINLPQNVAVPPPLGIPLVESRLSTLMSIVAKEIGTIVLGLIGKADFYISNALF
jgi:hypothetical protein